MQFYEHVNGWACLVCGNISTGGMIRKLAKSCDSVLHKMGRSNLHDLERGKWSGRSANAKDFNAALKRKG
eukprot:4743199-Pyramimonas_sp.AAC.1